MRNVIKGTVHKFGDNINTDLISPAKYMEMSFDIIAAHAMEGADPDFHKKVKKGDIIVAGRNFGSGSSRETAPIAIKMNGISVIIAELFARIFYRNCINIGLPVLICEDTKNIRDGDELEANLEQGTIYNITRNQSYKCSPLPEHILKIINCGGLEAYLEHRRVIIKGGE